MQLRYAILPLVIVGLLSALPAAAQENRDDEDIIRITIRARRTDDKGTDTDRTSKEEHRHRHRRHREDDDDDDEDTPPPPHVRLLTGTFEPRSANQGIGNLRQYSLASRGVFLDYYQGRGAVKTDLYGVGFQSKFFRASGPIAPFLGWGWGVFHGRTSAPIGASPQLSGSQTRLGWKLRLGVELPYAVAEFQILDAQFKQGLRGSGLMVGIRY